MNIPAFVYGDVVKTLEGITPTKANAIYTLIRILIILKRPNTKPSIRLIPIKRKKRDISPAIFFGTSKEVRKFRNDVI